jgi:hypothetical protein
MATSLLQHAAEWHSNDAARLRYAGAAHWLSTWRGPQNRRWRTTTVNRCWRGTHRGRGGLAPRAGATVAGQILAPAVGEVGQE